MNCCAVVATHHKTGSLWMRTVFQSIAEKLEIPFLNMGRKARPYQFEVPSILFNNHSEFSNNMHILRNEHTRVLHIIRDPRDIVISAMHYHRFATERWLHKPQESFGRMSYQEKLNSFADDYSRYVFEMLNGSARIIQDIRKWNYSQKNCLEYRYEDLMNDVTMEMFTKAVLHLGFEIDELDVCRNVFWKNSLFGRKQGSKSKHVRSGKTRQWQSTFDEKLAATFLTKFGDVLIELGYESDHSWAKLTKPTVGDGKIA